MQFGLCYAKEMPRPKRADETNCAYHAFNRGNAKCVIFKNAVRAKLVDRADPKLLSAWQIPRLPNWVRRVNEPLTEKEIDAVRWSLKRGSPFGDETWVESTALRLNLESTLRPRGRPQVRNLPNKDS